MIVVVFLIFINYVQKAKVPIYTMMNAFLILDLEKERCLASSIIGKIIKKDN